MPKIAPALTLLGGLTLSSWAAAGPGPTAIGKSYRPTPASAPRCAAPTNLPSVRRHGKLTVHSPPKPAFVPGGKRLRTHTSFEGYQVGRVWHGPEVPAFVPLRVNNVELDLLDPIPGGYLALYRESFDSCGAGIAWKNCETEVRLFDCSGQQTAAVELHRHFPRKDHLEVQDVRLEGNVLYYNEACQTYSRKAGGRCSSLVAFDLSKDKRLWRTRNLTSNNVFLIHGEHIIAGYGFTAETSALHILRKKDGKRLFRKRLKTKSFPGGNHDALSILTSSSKQSVLRVGVYEHRDDLLFRLEGLTGKRPRLVYLGTTPPPRAAPPRRPSHTLPKSPPGKPPILVPGLPPLRGPMDRI